MSDTLETNPAQLRANARVEKVKDNKYIASVLEQAADTLQAREDEIVELRKQLEQAEARCKHYEAALERAMPIIQTIRAIIREEATSPASPTATAPKSSKPE